MIGNIYGKLGVWCFTSSTQITVVDRYAKATDMLNPESLPGQHVVKWFSSC